MPVDIAELFHRLTVGVHVVGVAKDGECDAFTASAVMQVSLEPLRVVVAVNPEHSSYRLLGRGAAFAISVLRQQDLDVARHFGAEGASALRKLAPAACDRPVSNRHRWHCGRGGAPILDHALAFFECTVLNDWAVGDHRLVLGDVVNGDLVDPDATPLLYAQTGDMDGSRRRYPRAFGVQAKAIG